MDKDIFNKEYDSLDLNDDFSLDAILAEYGKTKNDKKASSPAKKESAKNDFAQKQSVVEKAPVSQPVEEKIATEQKPQQISEKKDKAVFSQETYKVGKKKSEVIVEKISEPMQPKQAAVIIDTDEIFRKFEKVEFPDNKAADKQKISDVQNHEPASLKKQPNSGVTYKHGVADDSSVQSKKISTYANKNYDEFTAEVEKKVAEQTDSDNEDDLFFNDAYESKHESPVKEEEKSPEPQKLFGYEENYDESDDEEELPKKRLKFPNFLKRKNDDLFDDDLSDYEAEKGELNRGDEYDSQVEEDYFEEEFDEDEILEEPDLLEASREYSTKVHSLIMRCMGAFVICLVMVLFTLIAESGKSVPFGIGQNRQLLTGILMIMQLFVMALGIDILITGVSDIINKRAGAETLVLLSCVVSIVNAFILLLRGSNEGLPFCAVSAVSVFFAMRGKQHHYVAMTESLRTAASATSPYSVVSDNVSIDERNILKKVSLTTEGFYRNIVQKNITETVFEKAAPILIVLAIVFSIVVSIGKGNMKSFAQCFSAMIALCASFSSLSAYSLPFSKVAKKVKLSGAAIAGWGGICDISDSDGALITDDDIFPVGTVSIGGIKLFENISQRKAIVYASSVVMASKSGLSKVFSELLKGKGYLPARVDNFEFFEGGGIGGVVNGELVIVGTAGFMNLRSIRIPENVSVKNGVFVAINDKLIATFTINYVPANSVQAALIAMLRTKFSMLFAVRDFNLTPIMLQQRFKVSMKDIEYMSVEDCYNVSTDSNPEGCHAAAILCREGLGPFADVITRGKQLYIVSILTTILTLVGAVFGMLLLLYICWNGAFDLVRPGSVFVYMLAVHIAVSILSSLSARK